MASLEQHFPKGTPRGRLRSHPPTEIICEALEIALEIKRTPGANAWTRLDLQGNPEALVIEFAEGGA